MEFYVLARENVSQQIATNLSFNVARMPQSIPKFKSWSSFGINQLKKRDAETMVSFGVYGGPLALSHCIT